MISWLLALLASPQVPYDLLALVQLCSPTVLHFYLFICRKGSTEAPIVPPIIPVIPLATPIHVSFFSFAVLQFFIFIYRFTAS